MMSDKKLNESDLISVVIPCFNDDKFIEQAVESVLSQTYSNIEVIIVDDGSNTETKEVLKSLKPKITKLITQENKGQSTARNVGIKQAKGDYILVLDSDDYFEPTFCEKAIKVIKESNNVKLVTCYANLYYDNNKDSCVFKPIGGTIKNFIISNCALGSAMFQKKDCLFNGGYDQSMKNGFEDWEFYIRLLKKGGSAYVIPEPLYNYRKRCNTTTSRANRIKYDLLKFIYLKHIDLYKENFEVFISHLLKRIEREEKEKIKNTQRIDFKIGKFILQPFRWIKSLLR